MVLSHLVTAGARLAAFQSNFHFSVLIALWAAAQLLRLFVLGANAEVFSANLWQIGALVALDKWAGSLGEIALESALLSRLESQGKKTGAVAGRERWLVPAVALLALLQPLEVCCFFVFFFFFFFRFFFSSPHLFPLW